MKSENNGKIAIAIVAMFVIALTVVGFTYAYFTAQVRGNTSTKSVDVTAGRLQVAYTSGDQLIAQNIVPGWTSDNAHYYDPIYSKYSPTTVNNETTYKIKAVSTSDTITCNVSGTSTANTAVSACDGAVASPSSANGKVGPVTFSVANHSDNTGNTKYAITLTDITNNIADKTNLYVSLYIGGTYAWSGNLAASGTQVIGAVQGIDAGASAKNYSVYLTYQNVTDGDQDSSRDQSVSFKVKIIGVASNDGGTTYYDEDGNLITFSSTATDSAPSLTTTASE